MVFRFIIPMLLALLMTGCWSGRTEVRTSDGMSYDIYKVQNNSQQLICPKGINCELFTRGTSDRAVYQARNQNNRIVGAIEAERSITLSSILWIPFTYCTSLFLYQGYTDNIIIPINPRKKYDELSGEYEDDTPNDGSFWEQPLY